MMEEERKKTPSRPLESITFEFSGFYDDKVFDRFVKSVEKLVRSDRSYSNYVGKIKETEDNLAKDVIFE